MDEPESVRQWLLQSWVSVRFSQRLFFQSTHAALKILLINVGSVSCAQHPLTRDGTMCTSKEAKLATFQPMYFCPYCLGSGLVKFRTDTLL